MKISSISNPLEILWSSKIKIKGTAQEFKDKERLDDESTDKLIKME